MRERRLKVLCLHGFTLNGQVMRRQMGSLVQRLDEYVDLVFLDAPHTCSEESVSGLVAKWGTNRTAAPHLKWWEASDGGSEYRGWTETLNVFQGLMAGEPPVALLGFSQGAILATALALCTQAELLPALDSVVVVAGGAPRASEIVALRNGPLVTPSLHVWGEQDRLMGKAPADLCTWYQHPETITWVGPHLIPRRGSGADAVVRFLAKRAHGFSN